MVGQGGATVTHCFQHARSETVLVSDRALCPWQSLYAHDDMTETVGS